MPPVIPGMVDAGFCCVRGESYRVATWWDLLRNCISAVYPRSMANKLCVLMMRSDSFIVNINLNPELSFVQVHLMVYSITAANTKLRFATNVATD